MNFAVVVDVPPIEASAAASVLSTCNAALGAQHCAIAGPDVSGQWYAVVRFAPEQSTVFRIELHDGTPSGTQVAASQLEFKDRDSERERWASAGVVVAALVAAQSAGESEPPPKTEPAKPAPLVTRPPLNPPPRPRPVEPPYWPRVDIGATLGSENQSRALRVGPLGRIGVAFAELPVFALASAAYTVRGSGSPDSTWFTGSLGFGVRVGFMQQRGAVELRTEGVLETVRISASDDARSAHARRTRFGPRLGLDLSGYLMKNLALVAGAEAAALHPAVQITVAGQNADRLPPFAWGFISLLRYDFR